MDVFDLAAKISLDSSEYERGLNDASKKSKSFASNTKSALLTFGKVSTAAIGSVAVGFGTLATAALKAEGELEQGIGGSEAVFEEYAHDIQTAAVEAYSRMGLSANEFIATANKMGALFKGTGFEIADAADLTVQAMQRASDIASIMGIDVMAAMEAITGAAKGNFTMMDNLGVAMTETTLNAYALANGIEKTTKEMTSQEKVALAMEMFLDKTAYAAGNYAKENETLAGALQTAKSALSNFLSGTIDVDELLTTLGDSFGVVSDKIGELLPRLATTLTELIGKSIPMIPEMVKSVTPSIVESFSILGSAVVDGLPNAIREGGEKIGTAINLLADNFPEARQKISDEMDSIGEKIGEIASATVKSLATIIVSVGNLTMAFLDDLPEAISEGGADLAKKVSQIASDINNFADELPEKIGKAKEKIAQIIDEIALKFDDIGTAIEEISPEVEQAFKELFDAIHYLFYQTLPEDVKQMVDKIGEIFTEAELLMEEIWLQIQELWSEVSPFFEAIWALLEPNVTFVTDFLSAAFEEAGKTIENVFTGIGNWALAMLDSIRLILSIIRKTIAGDFEGAWKDVKNSWAGAVQFFEDIANDIVEAVSWLPGKIAELTKDAVEGLKEGFSNVGEYVSGEFEDAVENVKNFLGIKSPSRVFRQIGKYMVQGLELGWDDNIDKVHRDIESSLTFNTASIDFSESAIGKSSAATINSMLLGQSDKGGEYNINLVVDGRTLANVVFDPLNNLSKQKGVMVGA